MYGRIGITQFCLLRVTKPSWLDEGPYQDIPIVNWVYPSTGVQLPLDSLPPKFARTCSSHSYVPTSCSYHIASIKLPSVIQLNMRTKHQLEVCWTWYSDEFSVDVSLLHRSHLEWQLFHKQHEVGSIPIGATKFGGSSGLRT